MPHFCIYWWYAWVDVINNAINCPPPLRSNKYQSLVLTVSRNQLYRPFSAERDHIPAFCGVYSCRGLIITSSVLSRRLAWLFKAILWRHVANWPSPKAVFTPRMAEFADLFAEFYCESGKVILALSTRHIPLKYSCQAYIAPVMVIGALAKA